MPFTIEICMERIEVCIDLQKLCGPAKISDCIPEALFIYWEFAAAEEIRFPCYRKLEEQCTSLRSLKYIDRVPF